MEGQKIVKVIKDGNEIKTNFIVKIDDSYYEISDLVTVNKGKKFQHKDERFKAFIVGNKLSK